MTNKDEAKRSIEAIEKALKAGYKPPNVILERNEKAAISMAAEALGIPRQTLKSRVAPNGLCSKHNLTIDWNLWSNGEESPLHQKSELAETKLKLLSLQHEVIGLRKKLIEAHKHSLDENAIQNILVGVSRKEITTPEWLLSPKLKAGISLPEVPVTLWSDWHGGETVRLEETNGMNEFNNSVLDRRVQLLVERTIDLCKNHGPGNYPGIVINLLGDFVSGGIHPELAKTDEEEIIPTTLRIRDLLVWALTEMINAFGFVYCPCTSGNHGRNTQKPEYKRLVFKNFDWMIYQLLKRHFKDEDRIIFDVPESNEVHYQIYGQRYLAMHGDMLGVKGGDGLIGAIGPIMRGALKVGRQAASMNVDFDMLLCGHWHQTLSLPGIIVNNALKGSDEYALKSLRAVPSIPSQVLFFVHPKFGRTTFREIYLEEKQVSQDAPWVSVFK